MGRILDVGTDDHLRDAMEGRRTFSSIKRIFGETVRATSTRGMLREVRMKLYGYNLLTAMVT